MNIKKHLSNSKSIVVVGFSNDKLKAANTVPKYLTRYYDVIPVNPNHSEIVGLKSYSNLKALDIELEKSGRNIDIINVFRPSKECFEVVKEIVEMNVLPKLIWLQLHLRNEKAKQLALDHKIDFIQDKCIYVVHKDLFDT